MDVRLTCMYKKVAFSMFQLELMYSHFCFMLAEQYDAFVKFTHDQIMRRYGEQPASCEY